MVKTIAVDIGHGTNTSGKGVTVGGKFYKEHTFNSAVGVELDKLLRHNGFNTIMYQKPNAPEVKLSTRTSYYNSKNVDLVWSIHADANSNKDAKGRYAFYWHDNNDSKRLANLYAKEMKKAGYSTRGDGTQASELNSWTNLAICRDTNADAVLTENGFMTNDQDFQLIFNSEKYITDMARVHAKAICSFYGVSFKDLGTESVTETVKPVTPAVKGEVGSTYTIKKGDTLWGIAKACDTTVEVLEKLNPGVEAKALQVGDVLQVTAIIKAPSVVKETPVRPYPKKPLGMGSRGRDVEALQQALGLKGNAVDGIFGLNTLNAVKRYQTRHNLVVDGYVGPITWNKIFLY
ncbi:N-acetylmuramoyl-L-alanine amidase [Solibacillus silvestris]